MVKFIGNWMFASRIWKDAQSTPTAINMREVTHIEEMEDIKHGIHTVVLLKDKSIVPIEGDSIEILAEFQKHLQTMY